MRCPAELATLATNPADQADQVAADATRGRLAGEARISARGDPESGWPPQLSSAIRNPDGDQPNIAPRCPLYHSEMR
jgi:hypothetical protein